MTNKKEVNEFIEFCVCDLIGIDTEEEDRDVGLFGDVYSLTVIDDQNKQITLHLAEEEFYKLCEECHKHWENFKAEEKMEEEMGKELK